jgi:hypothetical protein
MKKIIITLVLSIAAIGLYAQQPAAAAAAEANVVNVYNFHGKQRCMTCVAIGNVARKTVETAYADNVKVRFIDIDASEKANEKLVKKYEIFGSSLIIAKGENHVNLTNQAFANAVRNPQTLGNLIISEINKRLTN